MLNPGRTSFTCWWRAPGGASATSLDAPPDGCHFHPRCAYAKGICETEKPELREVTPDHFCACHFAGVDGDAIIVAPPFVMASEDVEVVADPARHSDHRQIGVGENPAQRRRIAQLGHLLDALQLDPRLAPSLLRAGATADLLLGQVLLLDVRQ